MFWGWLSGWCCTQAFGVGLSGWGWGFVFWGWLRVGLGFCVLGLAFSVGLGFCVLGLAFRVGFGVCVLGLAHGWVGVFGFFGLLSASLRFFRFFPPLRAAWLLFWRALPARRSLRRLGRGDFAITGLLSQLPLSKNVNTSRTTSGTRSPDGACWEHRSGGPSRLAPPA